MALGAGLPLARTAFANLPMSAPIPRRALFLLIALTLIWGTNWPLFPYAVREVSVWTFRGIAMFGSGATLLLFARMRGMPLAVPRRYWKTIALATASYLVVWNICSTYAAVLIPSGQAAVLGFTMPLWGALIAWAVLGERLSPRLMLAVVLGGIGQIAMHGTNHPNLLGQAISNGCVRMDNTVITQMADLAPAGTPVEVLS